MALCNDVLDTAQTLARMSAVDRADTYTLTDRFLDMIPDSTEGQDSPPDPPEPPKRKRVKRNKPAVEPGPKTEGTPSALDQALSAGGIDPDTI